MEEFGIAEFSAGNNLVVVCKSRFHLMEHDIESGISYIPCHHFSLFKGDEELPVTDHIYEEILCIPMHYELSDNDVQEVCARIKEFVMM